MSKAENQGRTEKPTERRLSEARKDGRIARSQDLSTWGGLLIATFLLPWAFSLGESRVLAVTAQAANAARHPSVRGAMVVLERGLLASFEVIAPVGGFAALGALAIGFLQVGKGVSLAAARPKFDHLNPRQGLKRIVGMDALVGLSKQLLKLVAIGVIAWPFTIMLLHRVPATVQLGVGQTLGLGAPLLLEYMRVVCGFGFAIGVLDFFLVKRRLMGSLKMTKQEVKDDLRSAEGDPHMRGEIRRHMYRIGRQKTIAGVHQADVVVTNPTRFAVGVKYDQEHDYAPRVVAKGFGELAQRVKDEAISIHVPVIEDPPLARYLWAVCEVGQEVPGDIYLAVATLLAFVYALPDTMLGMTVNWRAHSQVPFDPGDGTETMGRRRRR